MTDPNELMASMTRTLETMLRQTLLSTWCAMPGIVTDTSKLSTQQTISVQPAIKGILAQPEGPAVAVPLPILPDVLVCWPTGGGATMTFPIAVGDECLVVFGDRGIDWWWNSGGVQLPFEARQHDLSDGFAVFGPRSKPRLLPAVSTSAVQLRTDDGQAVIELTPGTHGVRVETPGDVEIRAQNVRIAAERTDFDGQVWANGHRIDETHRHGGVRTGAGQTTEVST